MVTDRYFFFFTIEESYNSELSLLVHCDRITCLTVVISVVLLLLIKSTDFINIRFHCYDVTCVSFMWHHTKDE